jgi:hypothetical protein
MTVDPLDRKPARRIPVECHLGVGIVGRHRAAPLPYLLDETID